MSRLGFSGRLLFGFAVVCFVAYVSETRSGGRGGPRGSRGGFRSGSRYRSSRRTSVGIGVGSNGGHYYHDHYRGGEGTSTAGMIAGIVIAVIILAIFILVLSCIFCRCRSCNCKHTSSDEDNDIPTSKHAISRYKASRDNTDDVTKPLSCDSAVNDYRAGYSDSESTDSLPYSAKDQGYSSTRYSTGTSNGLPYPEKPSGNPAYSVYPSAGYSTGTSNGLPYPEKPSGNPAYSVYPSAGYSTGTSNGLPYPEKPSGNSPYSVYPSAGYSSGTSSGLHYSSNPSRDYPAAGYSNAGLPYSAKPTEEVNYSAPSAPPFDPGNEPSAQIGFESMTNR